ncbi:MAG: hypothetical protein L0154_00755, partial [Chloroflexi bacterium]|nr:hypothetical protein [Chloroflexota bacterium]
MFRKIFLVSLLIVGYLSVVWQPAGAAPGDVITVVDSSGSMGDMVVNSSGNPVFAYYSSGSLKLAVCSNPTCTSKTTRTLASDITSSDLSIALSSDGFPVIAYQQNNNYTGVIVCTDATCGGVIFRTEILGTGDSISLALTPTNLPRISYHWYHSGNNKGSLWLHVCNDFLCLNVEDQIIVDSPPSPGRIGEFNSLKLNSGGTPVFSYYDGMSDNLKLATCLTYNCAPGTSVYTTLDSAGDVGTHTSLKLIGGTTPVIAYKDETNDRLKLVICSNQFCTFPAPTIRILDPFMGSFGGDISLTLDSGNRPIVSYDGDTFGLNLITCLDPTCFSWTLRDVDNDIAGTSTSVAWNSSTGTTFIAYQYSGLRLAVIAPKILVTVSSTPATPPPPNVAEAGSRGFTFTLSTRPSSTVNIPISVSNSAQCSANVSSVSLGTANWNSGQTVTVSGIVENFDDGDQTCNLITGDPTSSDSYYNAMTSSASPNVGITVINDDTAGFSLEPNPVPTINIPEAGSQDFTFKLTSEPTAPVTFVITVLNPVNCRVNGVNDQIVVLNSTNWNTGNTVTISGAVENFDDGNQLCDLQTSDPFGSDPVYDAMTAADTPDFSVNIIDDDTAGITVTPNSIPANPPAPDVAEAGSRTFNFKLTSQPTAGVTIPLSVSSSQCTVNVSSVLLGANWSTGVSVTVSGVVESIDDGNQPCNLITGDPTSTDPVYNAITASQSPDQSIIIIDDDGGITVTPSTPQNIAEAGSGGFTFRLTSAPTADVTIPLSVGSAQCTVNVPSVVLTAVNWSTGVVATVSGVVEDVDDGNQPCNLISGDPTSADPVYNILTAANSPDVNITITDDDVSGISLTPDTNPTIPPPPNVAEAGSRNFILTLDTIPSDPVTIPISVSDTSQCVNDMPSVMLDAGNWDTGATVQISGVPEMIQDGNQPCTLITGDPTSSDPNYNALNATDSPDITFNMIDDDTVGVSVTPSSSPPTPSPPNVAEAGSREFTVTLNTQPTDDVVIFVSVSDTSQCTVNNSLVTLTATNWDSGFVVTVSGVVESIDDGDQPCNLITGDVLSNDPNYDALDASDTPDTNITIIDDDPIDTPTHTPTDTPTDTPTATDTPTDTPTKTPTHTPTDTPTNTPTGPAALLASAACNLENLEVAITAGDGPFNITASAGINTPVNGVSIGTTTINGPEKWDNLTVTETTGDMQAINLGQFKCRSDEVPVPL